MRRHPGELYGERWAQAKHDRIAHDTDIGDHDTSPAAVSKKAGRISAVTEETPAKVLAEGRRTQRTVGRRCPSRTIDVEFVRWTVGIAASARAVQDADRVGEVLVTGLGTPNQMRKYVESGSSPQFTLWNPADLGYLAFYTLIAIASGEIAGDPGDSFDGRVDGAFQ